jgi:hypothetical protein
MRQFKRPNYSEVEEAAAEFMDIGALELGQLHGVDEFFDYHLPGWPGPVSGVRTTFATVNIKSGDGIKRDPDGDGQIHSREIQINSMVLGQRISALRLLINRRIGGQTPGLSISANSHNAIRGWNEKRPLSDRPQLLRPALSLIHSATQQINEDFRGHWFTVRPYSSDNDDPENPNTLMHRKGSPVEQVTSVTEQPLSPAAIAQHLWWPELHAQIKRAWTV